MDVVTAALVGREPYEAGDDVESFWRQHVADARAYGRPIDRAISGGIHADRLGFAFVAGYAAAVQALFRLGSGELGSVAVTEEGGTHPRAIAARLEPREGGGFALTGHKRWVTEVGGTVFVLARAGEVDARGRTPLRVAKVTRDAPGVRIVPQPPPPFVPEVLHAEVILDAVPLTSADVLPGDGWGDWMRPFRTVEDLHVHGAVLGYLASCGARYGFPRPLREATVSQMVTLRALAGELSDDPAVHLALAGTLERTRVLLEALEPHWDKAPAEVRERWQRDRPLLEVAGRARAERTAKAWERIESSR